MGPVEAVKTVFSKYADFEGRASRSEFWWFTGALWLAAVLLGALTAGLGLFLFLGVIVPSTAVTARRMHDIGQSGWMQLIAFLPVIGWIAVLVMCILPGQPHPNGWGPVPAP